MTIGARGLSPFSVLGICALTLAASGCHSLSNEITAAGGAGGQAKGGTSGSGGSAGGERTGGASGSTGGTFGFGGAAGSAGQGGSSDGGGTSANGECADALIALDRSCSMTKVPTGFTKSKYAVAQDVLLA